MLKKIQELVLCILTTAILVVLSSGKTAAATVTVSTANKTSGVISFDIVPSSPFVQSPAITIYRNHGCSGTKYVDNAPVEVNLTHTSATYDWSSIPPSQDFSVQVSLNDPGSTTSNCLDDRTLDVQATPHPPSPEEICPDFVGFNPQGNQFLPDQTFSAIYAPKSSELGNINEFEANLIENNSIIDNPALTTVTLSGETFWAATIEPPDTVGNSYHVSISIQGFSCRPQGFSVVNSISGQNPCGEEGAECQTAFGPIPTNITEFAGKFLSIALGIAGGIALILLVFGSVRVLTSSGNQQTLAAGRDTIIAAIAGLLFLIFSVLILRALGVAIGITL